MKQPSGGNDFRLVPAATALVRLRASSAFATEADATVAVAMSQPGDADSDFGFSAGHPSTNRLYGSVAPADGTNAADAAARIKTAAAFFAMGVDAILIILIDKPPVFRLTVFYHFPAIHKSAIVGVKSKQDLL